MLLPCGKRLLPSIICKLPLKMPEQYFYYQRKYELCGFQAKKCVRIVAWLQMIVSTVVVGTLLHCWSKLSSEEGQNILRELLVIFYSPVVNIESEAKQLAACNFLLAVLAFSSSAGLITGLLLLDGTFRGSQFSLKLWMVYALSFVNVDLIIHAYLGWPNMSLCLRMVVTTAFYLFGIWAVSRHLEELSLRYDPLSFTIPDALNLNNEKIPKEDHRTTNIPAAIHRLV